MTDPVTQKLEACVSELLHAQAPARSIVVSMLALAARIYRRGAQVKGLQPDVETWLKVSHFALTGRDVGQTEVSGSPDEVDQVLGRTEPAPEPEPEPEEPAPEPEPEPEPEEPAPESEPEPEPDAKRPDPVPENDPRRKRTKRRS